jgi:hypothetical protein
VISITRNSELFSMNGNAANCFLPIRRLQFGR